MLLIVFSTLLAGLAAFLLYRLIVLQYNNSRYSHIPGHSTYVHPFTTLGFAMPWTVRKELHPIKLSLHPESALFGKFNSPIVRITSPSDCSVMVNDADYFKEIVASNKRFYPKPVHHYSSVQIFGENIVTTEGSEWVKHRTVINPAFGELNNALVGEITVQVGHEMLDKWDRDTVTNADGTKEVRVADMFEDMMFMALDVIGGAGFGQRLNSFAPAKASEELPAGHTLRFEQTMQIVSTNVVTRIAVPKFIFDYFPHPKLRSVARGFSEFEQYMKEMIDIGLQRRSKAAAAAADSAEAGKPRGRDVLSLLLTSMDLSANAKSTLTPAEVVANTFIFILAGHETTAHTLGFAFSELALRPEVQEKLYQEALAAVTSKPTEDEKHEGPVPERYKAAGYRPFTYQMFKSGKLEYAHATFLETLRLYPIVSVIPKWCPEGATLGPYKLPPQTYVDLHVRALHRNAKHWPEPDEFRPERFDERVSPPINKFAYAPFSLGPRACIGKQFAQIEGSLILAMVCLFYTIHPDPSCGPNPTVRDIVNETIVLTLQNDKPVKLVLRPRAQRK